MGCNCNAVAEVCTLNASILFRFEGENTQSMAILRDKLRSSQDNLTKILSKNEFQESLLGKASELGEKVNQAPVVHL